MINSIFEFFEKLITQFTWRRLFFVFISIFIISSCLIIYETYTGHFRLNRIEKSTNLLKKLTNIYPKIREFNNKEISSIFKGLTKDLDIFINHKFTPFSLPTWLLKILAAVFPWVLLSFFMIASSYEDIKIVLFGILFFSVLCASIGAILPDFKYPSLNYLIYPIVSTALIILIITFWNKRRRQT